MTNALLWGKVHFPEGLVGLKVPLNLHLPIPLAIHAYIRIM